MQPIITYDRAVERAPDDVKKRLMRLKMLRENPDWHPEDNCFEHVRVVYDRARETGCGELAAAALFHDSEKWSTAEYNPRTGYPTCPGHDKAAAELVLTHRDWLTMGWGVDADVVHYLVLEHMRIKVMHEMTDKKRRKLEAGADFRLLQAFALCDNMIAPFDQAAVNGLVEAWRSHVA